MEREQKRKERRKGGKNSWRLRIYEIIYNITNS